MAPKSFNLNIIEELHQYGNQEQLRAVFKMFEKELKQGHSLILQRRYMNAQAEVVIEINSLQELETFTKRFLPVPQ